MAFKDVSRSQGWSVLSGQRSMVSGQCHVPHVRSSCSANSTPTSPNRSSVRAVLERASLASLASLAAFSFSHVGSDSTGYYYYYLRIMRIIIIERGGIRIKDGGCRRQNHRTQQNQRLPSSPLVRDRDLIDLIRRYISLQSLEPSKSNPSNPTILSNPTNPAQSLQPLQSLQSLRYAVPLYF